MAARVGTVSHILSPAFLPPSMTGALAQLGYLASYSSEMFHELCELAYDAHKRLDSCTKRTATLLEKSANFQPGNASASCPPDDRKGEDVEQGPVMKQVASGFLAVDMPRALHEKYMSESIKSAPDFSPVEAAMTEADRQRHGACAKIYSDPHFFFSEWKKKEEERYRAQIEAKEQRRKEKRSRKLKNCKGATKGKAEASSESQPPRSLPAEQPNWKSRYTVEDVGVAKLAQQRQVGQSDNKQEASSLATVSKVSTRDTRLKTVDNERSVYQAIRAGGAVKAGGGEQLPPPRR